MQLFDIDLAILLITACAKSNRTKITVVIIYITLKFSSAVIAKYWCFVVASIFRYNKIVSLKIDHFVIVEASSFAFLYVCFGVLCDSFLDISLSPQICDDIFSLEVFILHHQLTCRTKQSSFKFINIMIELVCLFGFLRNIRSIDAELCFGDNDVSIPKIDH